MYNMYCFAFILPFIIFIDALDQSLSFNNAPAKATTAKSVRITRSTLSSDTNVFPNTEFDFEHSNFAPFPPSTIQTGPGSISSSSATSSFSPLLSNSNIQASPSSSNPFAASGSSTSSSTSFWSNEDFGALAKSLLAIPALAKFHDIEISGSEAASTFTDISSSLLNDMGNPDADVLAPLVGQNAASFESFPLPLFFQAAGNTFEKFFELEGIPTPPSFTEKYAAILEDSLNQGSISDSKSLYYPIMKSFVTLIESLGFDVRVKSTIISQIFASELSALQKSKI